MIIFDEALIGKHEEMKHLRKWVKVVFVDIWGCGGIAPPLLTSTPDAGE
jgi:hypothetical protein